MYTQTLSIYITYSSLSLTVLNNLSSRGKTTLYSNLVKICFFSTYLNLFKCNARTGGSFLINSLFSASWWEQHTSQKYFCSCYFLIYKKNVLTKKMCFFPHIWILLNVMQGLGVVFLINSLFSASWLEQHTVVFLFLLFFNICKKCINKKKCVF